MEKTVPCHVHDDCPMPAKHNKEIHTPLCFSSLLYSLTFQSNSFNIFQPILAANPLYVPKWNVEDVAYLGGPDAGQRRELLHVGVHHAGGRFECAAQCEHICLVDTTHGCECRSQLGQVVLLSAALNRIRRLALVCLVCLQVACALLQHNGNSGLSTMQSLPSELISC